MNSLMFQSSHSMDIFNISARIFSYLWTCCHFTKKDSLLQLVIGTMKLNMMFTKEETVDINKKEMVFKMLEEGEHKNREIMETTKMPRTSFYQCVKESKKNKTKKTKKISKK